MPPEGEHKREVIFEFITHGQSVKVTAVDVTSGTEVSIIAPAMTAQTELRHFALQKLNMVMAKGKGGGEPAPDKRGPSSDSGGGILV